MYNHFASILPFILACGDNATTALHFSSHSLHFVAERNYNADLWPFPFITLSSHYLVHVHSFCWDDASVLPLLQGTPVFLLLSSVFFFLFFLSLSNAEDHSSEIFHRYSTGTPQTISLAGFVVLR